MSRTPFVSVHYVQGVPRLLALVQQLETSGDVEAFLGSVNRCRRPLWGSFYGQLPWSVSETLEVATRLGDFYLPKPGWRGPAAAQALVSLLVRDTVTVGVTVCTRVASARADATRVAHLAQIMQYSDFDAIVGYIDCQRRTPHFETHWTYDDVETVWNRLYPELVLPGCSAEVALAALIGQRLGELRA